MKSYPRVVAVFNESDYKLFDKAVKLDGRPKSKILTSLAIRWAKRKLNKNIS